MCECIGNMRFRKIQNTPIHSALRYEFRFGFLSSSYSSFQKEKVLYGMVERMSHKREP